jgi:hypothetical protein
MTNLAFLDQDYLRIPTHHKIPLRKDWSLPIHHYYKEPLTISQLLKKYGEYGVRLGLFVKKNYHLAALYFRTSEIAQYAKLFSEVSYTQTENGLYYFILIKELPPNALLKDLDDNPVGNFYGKGKLVIGPHSLINGFTYLWIKRKQSYLTFNSLPEFLTHLLRLNLKLATQGSVQFDKQQKEWFCPRKLAARWKRRNFAKAKLKITKCLDCSRRIKQVNLLNHLIKIHHRKSRSQKRLRLCSQCKLNYSTLLKSKEHQQFYCVKTSKEATKLTYAQN